MYGYLARRMAFIMLLDEAGDKGAGGGGGGKDEPPAWAKQLIEDNKSLKERLEKYESKGKRSSSNDDDEDSEDDDQDDGLDAKARKMREADDKKNHDTKALESALTFSLKSEEFLRANQSLLPKEISEIFKAAERENYPDAVSKASAIKAGIIKEFFSVQSNMDLLTPGLKSTLEDYLKLTKNGKETKASQIYEAVFEPAFEMLKRTKKAEALSKGFGSSSEVEDAYKQKMINLSRKHYLGEKHGA